MSCDIIDVILDFRPTQIWLCLVIPYVPRYPCNCFSVPLEIFEPNLLLDTISLLQRSMTVDFRISTRTMEAHCQMLLDLLSGYHCAGNILIFPSPLYLNDFVPAELFRYIMFYFSLEWIYP